MSFFPSTRFSPLWNMIQLVLCCLWAVLPLSLWKKLVPSSPGFPAQHPWLLDCSERYCSVISASSLSFLFSMQLCLLSNWEFFSEHCPFFLSQATPGRGFTSLKYSLQYPLLIQLWIKQSDRQSSIPADGEEWSRSQQGADHWIHPTHLQDLDGCWDPHTRLEPGAGEEIKPRQQSPAAEFNIPPASF